MALCIIPARGNSQRLRKKNILPFKGKPMVAHVIEASILSGVFSDVIVSSDDQTTLEIAQKYGATPHERPQPLSKETASVDDVCVDVLTRWSDHIFCCIYATSVLLNAMTIRASYETFSRLGQDSCSVLMGVSSFNFAPVQALAQNEDGYWELMFKAFKNKQSQTYPATKVSNGTFYWAFVEAYLEERTFYSSRLKVFDVDPREVSDINTVHDYEELLKNNF
jgi:pseudaminic acid cytidylyltransferase